MQEPEKLPTEQGDAAKVEPGTKEGEGELSTEELEGAAGGARTLSSLGNTGPVRGITPGIVPRGVHDPKLP